MQYTPHPPDLVIGTIHHSSTDTYHVQLTPYTPFATLPQLSFESATKKTRPQLAAGDVVYARVVSASKDFEPELECVSGSSGKAEGLGPLKAGMVFDVSVGFARRLMVPAKKGGEIVLDVLAGGRHGRQGLVFEVAVGRNGRVWVNSDDVRVVVAVGRCLGEVDERGIGADDGKVAAVVGRVLKELGL
jgi:exosome complex component RRP40